MKLSPGKNIAFAYGSVTRGLYLHTVMVVIFLLIVISITIWAGNTLTMITAIARFERTHTVSRVEAMVALLKFNYQKKPEELEKFQAKMAITQSYNKVFSRLLDMRKDTSDAEFVRILESTFSETDHKTAVIIVNRIKVLYWLPILKDLIANAVGANAAGEKIKVLVSQVLAMNNEVERAATFAEIEKTEKEFILCETSFSKNCSALSNQISSYVSYIAIALLIISVGFTGMLTYMIAKTVLQQAARYTSDLEKEIQERKRAEAVLRDSEEKYRLLVDNLSSGVVVHAPDSSVIFSNPMAATLLGLTKDQMRGKEAMDPAWCFLRKNGTSMPLAEYPVNLVLSSGEPITNQVLGICHPDLAEPAWMQCNAYPVTAADGSLLQVVVTFSDITGLKVYEKMLQQKNAELERFTYTVSHDLKSPIITIKGFTGSLEKDLAKGNYERMAGDLKRVSDAADRMDDLLRDLLELSTIGRIINTPGPVDMNLLVADVLAQLAGPLKNRNLTVAVQPGLPEVLCDKRRMAEVLQNLLENAIYYMGDQAEPQILLGMREEAGENIFFVQDNGIGIDEKYHQIIFGLFNKLDAESSGTGIGLALVKRIIEVHGGRVWVDSEGEGKGSKFCFTMKEATK
jgi:K+-sensing histidine kinase KdpD